jgi:hypothetical protein
VDPTPGNVGDLMCAGFEQAELGRARAAAYREPRARAEAELCSDDDLRLGQAAPFRELG